MMPAIMRRTPQSEEAYGYGYVDFLKDVVQKTLSDTTAGFKRSADFSDEEIMQMAFAGVGGGTKVSKGVKGILKKYKSQGLTYDAFVNQIPDKPKFAYHQWTFRGEGPLARATLTTKGTSLDEFEEMVADRIRKFAKPMITANTPVWNKDSLSWKFNLRGMKQEIYRDPESKMWFDAQRLTPGSATRPLYLGDTKEEAIKKTVQLTDEALKGLLKE